MTNWGDYPEEDPEFWAGTSCLVLGLAWYPSFYFAALHQQKKLDKLNDLSFSSIYKQNIFKSERTSLDLGLDYIHNRTNTKTLGLGLTYNF